MTLTRDVTAIKVERLGAEFFVPRFSAFMVVAIVKKAEELYPMPDAKPYEMPLPDAVIEGDSLPALQNPEYQKLVARVLNQRNRYQQYAALDAGEVDGGTHEEVIALYKPMLDSVRKYAEIEGSDFALIMHYCILNPAEYREVKAAAFTDQALSQEEIRDGMRIFRRDLQRDSTDADRGDASAPDIQKVEQLQVERPARRNKSDESARRAG